MASQLPPKVQELTVLAMTDEQAALYEATVTDLRSDLRSLAKTAGDKLSPYIVFDT